MVESDLKEGKSQVQEKQNSVIYPKAASACPGRLGNTCPDLHQRGPRGVRGLQSEHLATRRGAAQTRISQVT